MKTEGYIHSPAGELYYQAHGDISATPLVAVHGGPGFTSYTLEPLYKLSSRLPVICYDQAGCGRARRNGARKNLSIQGFVDELEALRAHLALPQMHLLGHSFGALIIGEYALQYPQHVASLIFSSASIDIPRWIADAERLINQMPMLDKIILKEGIRTGNYYDPAFLKSLDSYYFRHINRFEQTPESIRRSIEESDAVAYETIWGPNEVVLTGTVHDYSLTPRLPELTSPVLFCCGRYDEATPEAHQFFSSQVPGSSCHVFEHSAHNTLITEEDEYLRVVGEFLKV